jgi:hypothetical protein
MINIDESRVYKIDELDYWTAFNYMIESGSDDFLAMPDSKEVYSIDFKDGNGKQYDLTKRYFEDKVVTQSGYILANTKGEFWEKYIALWNLITSPGARTIYCYELEQYFSAFYLKSPGVKRFTRLQNYPDLIAVKVDITWQVMYSEFVQPGDPTNILLPAVLPFILTNE